MPKTLYIHIGTCKTGTSAIQLFFTRNRLRILREEKLLFPVSGTLSLQNVDAISRHVHLFSQRKECVANDGSSSFVNCGGYDTEQWERLRREVAEYPECDVLISNEQVRTFPRRGGSFTGWDEEWKRELGRLFPEHEVKVIFYIRRLDDYYRSFYNQQLKSQNRVRRRAYSHLASFGSYCRTMMRNNFSDLLETIVTLFGKDNVVLRIYDASTLKNGDIIQDFCSIVGFDPKKYLPKTTRFEDNTRLADESLPYLALLPAIDEGNWSGTSEALYNEIIDIFDGGARGDGAVMDSLRREIDKIDSFIPGYKELFENRPLALDFPAAEQSPQHRILFGSLFRMRKIFDTDAYCALHNSLVEENPNAAHKPLLMPIPWDRAGHFEVFRNEGKGLSLTPIAREPASEKPVYAVAAQKAEWFLLKAVLEGIGLRDSGVHASDTGFRDFRKGSYLNLVRDLEATTVRVPYEMQTLMILSGQFLVGHPSPLPLKNALGEAKPLLIVRDLRNSVAASVYFNQLAIGRKPETISITPSMIREEFLLARSQWPCLTLMRNNARIMEFAHTVRFEELMSNDREHMRPSLAALAAAVGCSEEKAYEGVLASRSSPLMRFIEAAFDFTACWNEKVEFEFMARGLRKVNEELGYE